MRYLSILGVVLVAWAGLTLAQTEPLGIIVEPPEEGLSIRVWTDKPVYAIGDEAVIYFELNQPAYVYILNIDSLGRVNQLLPNYWEQQNYYQAGIHQIPGPGQPYHLSVVGPPGTEWIQVIATTQPLAGVFGSPMEGAPYPLLGEDPEGWRAQLEAQLLGLVPEPAQRAVDFTSFLVVAGTPPGYGTLQVNTNPPLARLYIDGVFRGWTPRSLSLTAGFHDVLIRKTGYQDYSVRVYIMTGGTRTLNIDLTPVAVNQPPVAQFSHTPTSPQPGQWVQFDASASYDPDGTITGYQWDFNGDGVFDASGMVVFHQFTVGGSYQVTLQVVDDGGAIDTETKTIVVQVPNQSPVADFGFNPTSPQPGQWVQFDASASYDPDGTIASYQWDFNGDGVFDASGVVAFWQFPIAGTYQVLLVVTDNLGATGQVTKPVVVGPVPNQPPVAQFTISPSVVYVGTLVTFDASASYDPDGAITSYQWDLDGDGVADHFGPLVTSTYYAPGTYLITLWVTDNQGATSQASQPLLVQSTGYPWQEPPMDGVPGVYVWGRDEWHITVNGSSSWTTPHEYRLELRTDGTFVGVRTEAGPSPLGLIPEPTDEGWRVIFTGSVTSNRITYVFRVQNATSIFMDLRLDMDGDGDLERSAGLVRLRRWMVNPPFNPLVVGLPEGHPGPLTPELNFRIGTALAYSEHFRAVYYQTDIETLEGGP
jgi:PKD repeat protein